MTHAIRTGTTDQIAFFRAYDTDGTAKVDLTSATTGLTLSVFRIGASAVSISSLSDKAADNTAHADGAIRQIQGNLYTVDLPDAAVASQCPSICVKGTYTGGVIEGVPHPIVGYDGTAVRVGASDGTGVTLAADQEVNTTKWGGTAVGSVTINANMTQISGDTAAADNAESFFDGTGYAGTNNVMPTVTTVTDGVVLASSQPNYAPLTTLGANAPAGWINADAIASSALDGKGNWNVGKTGYSLVVGTGLGNQTANITGNLSGSVGSVINGVTVTDKTGFSLASSGLDAVTTWTVDITGDLSGNIGGTLADPRIANLDATVSSRLASASYTSPDNSGISSLQDKASYILGILAGAISNAGNSAEEYTIDLDGHTFTITYSGLTSSGNRSTTILDKS